MCVVLLYFVLRIASDTESLPATASSCPRPCIKSQRSEFKSTLCSRSKLQCLDYDSIGGYAFSCWQLVRQSPSRAA